MNLSMSEFKNLPERATTAAAYTNLVAISEKTRAPSDGTVTPELAATVVKSYLLPLFEGESRSKRKIL